MLAKQRHELPLVLIADDDQDHRDMYAGHLSASGFRVARARDGVEAVKLAKELQPAVVVLDLHMPHVDGISATQQIRRDPTIDNTPILILTAYDIEEHDAVAAGATAVCVKPCLPNALVTQLQQLLKRRK